MTHEKDGRRTANVSVYGVDDRFWRFHGLGAQTPATSEARLSPGLERELGAQPGDAVLLRVEKPSAIPQESLHGRKDDSGRTMRFTVGPLAGEFALQTTQGSVKAVYIPLRRLQRDLAQQGRVNTLLLASTAFPKDKITLEQAPHPRLKAPVAGLVVSLPQPREHAKDPRVALRRERPCKRPDTCKTRATRAHVGVRAPRAPTSASRADAPTCHRFAPHDARPRPRAT